MEPQQVALVMGVTGMAGLSLAEALKKPAALGGPWKVYGAARRPKPSWFPSSTIDHYITFDAIKSEDTHKNLCPISHEITHVFWVAIHVGESEEANISVNSTMLSNVLNVLTCSSGRLQHVTLQTGTKHYMGPIFDPAKACQLVPHEPPFREDSTRLPYPNFYYVMEDLLSSYASSSSSLTWSVHRSSIIVGASSRTVYNTLLTLAVYASICRYEGMPFRYPGNRYTWEHFCDMSDAGVLAEQHIWAATTDAAKNQAFNCTNGDVFTWKGLWKVLCEVFDVEFVNEVESFDWVGEMNKKGKVWDAIVEEKGLYKTKMEEITCFQALGHVLHFEFQHVCSMTKSREFGFFEFVDTFKSVRMWVGKLRDMKIIP